MELINQKYRVSEVGIIPVEWEVMHLGDIANVIGGGTPSTFNDDYWNGDINWFTPTEIGLKKYSYESLRKITKKGFENSSARILPIGTILLTSRAGIGDVSILMNEACTNQGFQSLVAKGELNNEFLYYVVSTLKKVLLQNASGSTFLEISPKKVKSILVALPSTLKEQTAIATALSDTDTLIEILEKLIEKKRNIKQGVMHELLTGRKRLAGFNGTWKLYQIGEIADVGRGRVISHKEISQAIEGLYPVYSSQTTNDGIMGFIDTHDFEGEYITWTTDGVNAGRVFHRVGKFNCTNVCGSIKLKNDFHPFVAMVLDKATPMHVSRNLANPKLMNDPMKRISILLPEPEEQMAIVDILSDISNEIKTLEQKLNKFKMLKLGMMQVLLTGKIRLV
ncbi:MAG: restriction endonuclease subunit S [Bacteroidales bacterium]